jgi:hypothetical protein
VGKKDALEHISNVGKAELKLLKSTLSFVNSLLEGLTIPYESSFVPEFEEMIKLMTLSKKIVRSRVRRLR